MSNEIIGKTSCFNNCPIAHNCFEGHMSKNPMCEQENNIILNQLVEIYGVDNTHFLPKPRGLQYVVFSGRDIKTFKIDEGEVVEIRKALNEPPY